MTKTEGTNKGRESNLDVLRAVAIIVMVMAHSVAFFHDFSNSTLLYLMHFGNTVAFTTFLFTSGAVAYIAYLKNDKKLKTKNKRLLSRLLYLLIGYYVIAIIGNIKDFNLIRTILFIDVPGFTEFILAFVLYGIFLIPFGKFYRFLINNWLISLLFALGLYLVGYLIFPLDFGEIGNSYKSLFAGHQGLFRFPILQYFPVYMLGLHWGKFILNKNSKSSPGGQKEISFLVMLVFSLITLIGNVFLLNTGLFERWPPAPLFLTTSLSFVFVILTILYAVKVTLPKIVNRVMIFLGLNAFGVYIYQTIITLTYAIFPNWKFQSPLIITVAFILLIVGSSVLILLEDKVKNNVKTLLRKV